MLTAFLLCSEFSFAGPASIPTPEGPKVLQAATHLMMAVQGQPSIGERGIPSLAFRMASLSEGVSLILHGLNDAGTLFEGNSERAMPSLRLAISQIANHAVHTVDRLSNLPLPADGEYPAQETAPDDYIQLRMARVVLRNVVGKDLGVDRARLMEVESAIQSLEEDPRHMGRMMQAKAKIHLAEHEIDFDLNKQQPSNR